MLSFQATGLWWDPRVPDKQWHGTLRFDDALGTTLTLTMPEEGVLISPALRAYDVLHGRGSDGKLFTLLNAFDRSTQASFFGIPRSVEVYANRLIVGFHADDTDPLLSAVSVEFQHLTDWLGQTGISMDQTVVHPDVAVRYQSPTPIRLYEDDALTVTLNIGTAFGIGDHKFHLEEKAWFSIQAKGVLPLSHFDRVVRACGDLLSIACMVYCRTDELSLVTPSADDRPRRSGTFHAIPRYKQKPTDSGSVVGRMLFTFESIKGRAPGIFQEWLTKEADLRDARALYIEGLYGSSFVEHRLVALTHAAEAFHRRFYQGTFIPDNEFQAQVLTPMLAAIPAHLNKDFQASLKKRFEYANERSQRSRLNEMVKEHKPALEVLAPAPKDLVNPIVDVRNEFTHFPVPQLGSDTSQRPPAERVLYYNWFLRLLLEVAFLRVMGFTEDEIGLLVAQADTYRQVAGRFRSPTEA